MNGTQPPSGAIPTLRAYMRQLRDDRDTLSARARNLAADVDETTARLVAYDQVINDVARALTVLTAVANQATKPTEVSP